MRVTWGWAPTRDTDPATRDQSGPPAVRRTTAHRSAPAPSHSHTHSHSHPEGSPHV
jgi:hypothetical protein